MEIRINIIKYIVFVLLIMPLVIGGWQFFNDALGENPNDTLGANPIEAITHHTGEWALRILLLTLAISPARRVFRINSLIKFRRMLGLTCFIYVVTHFSIYIVLDQWFDLLAIIEDIKERPYITVGFLAFILMIPLAITSTDAMQKRLQYAWVKLHRLVYVIAILAILHFWWLVKADFLEPAIYASILLVLLAYRLRVYMLSRR